MYKIWVNDGATPKPDDDIFYEICGDGILLHKKMKHWHAVVPVKGIGFLNETNPSAKVFLPPIPSRVVTDMVRFFAWIYKKHRTEVGAMLWLNEETKTYRVSVPKQLVGYGSIEYKDAHESRLPGEVLIGTLHSHCDMSAYHSGTDTHDEESIDGIHVTFGKFRKKPGYKGFDISAEVAINGTRFGLNIVDWLGGIKEIDKEEIESEDVTYRGLSTERREKNLSGGYGFQNEEPVLPDEYAPPLPWVKQVTVKVIPKNKGRGRDGFFHFPFKAE